MGIDRLFEICGASRRIKLALEVSRDMGGFLTMSLIRLKTC